MTDIDNTIGQVEFQQRCVKCGYSYPAGNVHHCPTVPMSPAIRSGLESIARFEANKKTELEARISELEADNARLLKRSTDVYWPPGDVMDMMIEAVDHLLHKHDCDGPRHEEYLHALRQAKDHRLIVNDLARTALEEKP